METSLRCQHTQHAESCGKPAIYLCPGCGGPYCGEHVLSATFLGPDLAVPNVYTACQACLGQMIQQQHQQGLRLGHWQKAG